MGGRDIWILRLFHTKGFRSHPYKHDLVLGDVKAVDDQASLSELHQSGGEVMDGWKLVRAADFIDFNPSESLPKNSKAKKVAMERLQPYNRDITGFEIARFAGGSIFRNGDTLMARITPCLENGKTAQVSILEDSEIGFGSTEFIVLRAKPGVSDKDFVYYLSLSPILRDKAIKSMVGSSGGQRVQQGVLDNTEFYSPPLPEQIEIGRTLRALDDKIENNRKINRRLEQIAQAIFKSWFVDFEPWGGVMPEDWREGTLSEITNIVMGQSPEGSSYNENGIGTVFYQGRAEFGYRFPTRHLFTTEPKRMAKKGDILMSIRAPVGDLNIAFEPCCIGRGLAAVRSIRDCSSFTFYSMLALKQQLNTYNAEGTVFGSINTKDFANLKLLIPSDKLIDRFEETVRPLDNQIESNYSECVNLQRIRDLLLPRLMSGELSVGGIDDVK